MPAIINKKISIDRSRDHWCLSCLLECKAVDKVFWLWNVLKVLFIIRLFEIRTLIVAPKEIPDLVFAKQSFWMRGLQISWAEKKLKLDFKNVLLRHQHRSSTFSLLCGKTHCYSLVTNKRFFLNRDLSRLLFWIYFPFFGTLLLYNW